MRRFMTSVAPLAVISLVLSACTSFDTQPLLDEVGALSDDVASLSQQVTDLETSLTTTTMAESATTTTTSDPATTASALDIGRLAVAFFIASETLCLSHASLTGNPLPEHIRYDDVEVVELLDAERVEIEDGLDYRLIVDFASDPVTIYSSEGPEAILPFDLSFGCPPELYLGTLPS